MPDELPGEETGAVETPTTDWEQRYKDTHANWNSLNERFQKFEKDPQAVLEFLQDKHPDLLVVDEEPDTPQYEEPDEDEQPLTRAEWKAWQAEQAQAAKATAAQGQFEADYQKFVGDRELSPQGDAFIRHTASKGDIKGPDDLQKTVDAWFAYEDGLKTSGKPKPRVPHVPANGSAATDVPTYDGMSRAEVDRAMAERAMGHLSQS